MYRSYYNLDLKPFQISSDPRFLWLGENHKEALAVLKYGILDNKGFLLITGDVGTGKTTLINSLVNSLQENVVVATVPDPSLSLLDFLNYIASAFGSYRWFESKGEFLYYFKGFLDRTYRDGKKALLIIDEAQRLNHELLEEIRVLSNIEKQSTKLLNIFFVGQDEFNDLLWEDHNRALRQRITINYHLKALGESEIQAYISHRLQVAGAAKKIFTKDAMKAVMRYSGGFPRTINILCDHALLTGFVQGKHTIDDGIIEECAKDLQIPRYHNPVVKKKKAVKVIQTPALSEVPPEKSDPEADLLNDPLSQQANPVWTIIVPATVLLLIVVGYFLFTSTGLQKTIRKTTAAVVTFPVRKSVSQPEELPEKESVFSEKQPLSGEKAGGSKE